MKKIAAVIATLLYVLTVQSFAQTTPLDCSPTATPQSMKGPIASGVLEWCLPAYNDGTPLQPPITHTVYVNDVAFPITSPNCDTATKRCTYPLPAPVVTAINARASSTVQVSVKAPNKTPAVPGSIEIVESSRVGFAVQSGPAPTPLTLTCPMIAPVTTANSTTTTAIVTYPAATPAGGTLPYTGPTYTVASGSSWPVGTHSLNASVKDAAGATATCSSSISVVLGAAVPVPVPVPETGCLDVDMSTAPPSPLGTRSPIGMARGWRNQYSTTNQASAIGMLRGRGWRVEWSRVQFKDPSTPGSSDGGYFYILAWCVGAGAQ